MDISQDIVSTKIQLLWYFFSCGHPKAFYVSPIMQYPIPSGDNDPSCLSVFADFVFRQFITWHYDSHRSFRCLT